MRRAARLAGIALLLAACRLGIADELNLDARALFARSVASHTRLTNDGSAIELESGVLIEDDGPAAGFSYRPNEEKLSEKIRVKKQLIVADPRARSAMLLLGSGGALQATINGRPQPLRPQGKAGNYWEASAIPVDSLQKGSNEFVFHGTGKLWIARDDEFASGSRTRTSHPNRSAKSRDAGATWDDQRLGTSDNVDGEYYVRLFLDQYQPEGSVTTGVLDAGNLLNRAVALPVTTLGPISVRVDGEPGDAGWLVLRLRSGSSLTPHESTWSAWETFSSASAVLKEPRGRFLQVAVAIAAGSPLSSPRVRRLVVSAAPRHGVDWTDKLKVLDSQNPDIVRSSIPFTYEPLDHPTLAEFRRQSKLDEVAAGANTEFELIQRLAAWSARQWDKGHLSEIYPAWNVLAILEPYRDGKPTGGFCQQYNLVFLQACESFGLCGRAVSLGPGDHGLKIRGGHEVVEIWSNEFRKWIYVDGNMAWYFVDDATDVPLSLWELRERQLQAVVSPNGPPDRSTRIVHLGTPRLDWQGLGDWPPFAELRLIPRSDFLSESAPLPLNQGMRGWFWTGHHVWTDAKSPASLLYGQRVSDARNWNWTLNQARIALEAAAAPGELQVHLETETPSFAEYIVKIDDEPPKTVAGTFPWILRAGVNRLTVVPRNRACRYCIASAVRIEFQP